MLRLGRFGRCGGRGVRTCCGGGGREEVVVVAADGVADGFAPAVGVVGVDVLVLGDMDGLHESLSQVGNDAGGPGFYLAADNGGDEATEGGTEIASREIFTGKEIGQVFAESFGGAGLDFFLGVAEAEMRVAGGAWSAATAAIRESKHTQGHAVLGTERRHRSLLRVEIWDCFGEKSRQDARLRRVNRRYNMALKQERP